jgi:D-threo-aldose 1-dehydrogenase
MKIRNRLLNGPLSDMFRNIPDQEVAATVDAAWQEGTRYPDAAPFHGASLSEIRLGKALARHKGGEYLLSSKVGLLILDEVETGRRDFGKKDARAGAFRAWSRLLDQRRARA